MSHGSTCNLMQSLGDAKVCVKWVPKIPKDSVKEKSMVAAQELQE